jgi:hypothetical protein
MPFFEIGISWLKKGSGRLGYITPNTYFSSINGRGVRKMLTDRGIVEKIIDLDGFAAFEDLSTYTCVTILDKSGVKRPQVGVAKNAYELGKLSEIKLYPIDYSELQQNDWYIKPQSISRDMRQIETAGVSLQKYVARFTTGIATLRNDLYIFDTPVKDGYLVWKIDDKQFKIEVNATVPIIKPNKIKNHLQLAKNRERVLYPYRRSADGKRQELIPEDVMQKVFPGAYAYLKYIKHELDKRSSDAPASKWYAFGRSQALDGFGKKIILPMMSNSPSFLWVNDPKTLIYCGYALYPKSEHDVSILLKILNSDFFWYYISNTSKNYANGYKSFAKNYIKKFSIPRLDAKQKKLLLNLNSKETNQYLRKLYGLKS